ncbi:nidogen-1, partial [Plakobranchus ocellatus]
MRTSDAVYPVTVVAGLLALATLLPVSQAVDRSLFYPFGTRNSDTILNPGDDTSSDRIDLAVPIIFYNKSYSSLYVNMNGQVSFGARFPDYRPDFKIPVGQAFPFIAIFLADVDTSRSGRVYYRYTNEYEIRGRAAVDVKAYFSRFGDYMPTGLFIVTWDRVGYFSAQVDKLNTFQLVLMTDGVNSFALFHYYTKGQSWTVSQGKYAPGYLDTPPQAGFDGGRGGLSFILPGSGNTSEFMTGSNVDVPGVWIFQIGNLMNENIRTADLNTGAVTLFEMETQNNCYNADSVCHQMAECVDFRDSFCCKCVPPFYGNGIYCVKPGVAQVIHGKVVGTVNGIPMGNEVRLHTYVVTTEGKSYSSMSRVPESLVGPFQALPSVGGIAGWLFAQRVNPLAKNGFMVAGAKFNRTSRVTFYSPEGRNYTLNVQQYFLGSERLDHISMDTYLDGSLPDIPHNATISVDDYYENYKKVSPGVIKSFASRAFRVNEEPYYYTLDNTFTFEECGEEAEGSIGEIMRLFVSKHYAFLSPTRKNDVRYAMVSMISLLAGPDPCAEAAGVCHEKADCVPHQRSFKCICKAGYSGDGKFCEDVDECKMDACGPNADCFNVMGSFQCRCRSGFVAEGRICRAISCNDEDICGENARCVYDPDLREYVCECLDEFSGDGYSCEMYSGFSSCDACDRYAFCYEDESIGRYRCECRPGYSGDGTRCDVIDNCRLCDPYAQCVFNEAISEHECRCIRGYKGDGRRCEMKDCREDESMCHPEGGLCWFDENKNISICRCNYGYRGNGFECEVVGCDEYDYCDPNAECVYDGRIHSCRCNEGFEGDGRRCRRI